MTTRQLVSEDDSQAVYDVYDDAGVLIGQDVESKEIDPTPTVVCPSCGTVFPLPG